MHNGVGDLIQLANPGGIWVPLCPSRVCEITYDQRDGERFRHPGRFLRWRHDRDPRSCTVEQLAFLGPAPAALLQAS